MKYKIIIITLFITLIPFFSNAQNPILSPFGGNVLMTMPCTCSGGWYILMYDKGTKMPKPIVFQFGTSRWNRNYNIYSTGQSVLGSHVNYGICEFYYGYGCTELPVDGMVSPWGMPGIGTSMQ
jgi:hypothetical protein